MPLPFCAFSTFFTLTVKIEIPYNDYKLRKERFLLWLKYSNLLSEKSACC